MELKENHILIGLGGTGGKILKAFRKRMFQEYSAEKRAMLPIGYLYVDSSNEMMESGDTTWRVLGKDACFDNREFVFIKGVTPAQVLQNPSGYPGLKGFIGDPEVMAKSLGEVGAAAAQKRRAGRILFASSIQAYKSALLQQFNEVNSISGAVRTNIHIFTGLAGGTGSGSIIDVIAQTRMISQFQRGLSPDGRSGTNIVVYSMIPEMTPPGTCDAGRYHANGYAALTELNALLVKKYKPHDVTGLSDRINLDAIERVADGCILYSNTNEHGKIVDSFKKLPLLVSDFAYNRIFLEKNENTEEFIRSYSFENINDWMTENNEKAKDGMIDPCRSKAFSSFGIKRVIIPEEEIIDYFTYSFGEKALLQLRFNNWNDDLGYRDKPKSIDFHTFVKEAENLEKWRMTDKHLILDRPILPDDQKKWTSFADYWGGVLPVWTKQASKQNMPLNELERFCMEGYKNFFRKAGVESFFEGKVSAKEAHANEIAGLVEDFLFDKWKSGDYGLFNLLEFMDCIYDYTDAKRKDFEGKITAWNHSIDELEKAKSLNQLDWSSKGIIGGLFSKNKLIQAHSTILQQLYMKKTELAGMQFADSMLADLLTKLNGLRGRVEKFVNIINEAIEDTEKQIASRCQDAGNSIDLREAIIRFYDKEAVVKFTTDIIKNKKRQKSIADEFRTRLVGLIGNDCTFAKANANVTTDEISKLLDTVVRSKAISIHDEVLIENNEKLINRNILEQLSEKYHSEDALKKFATSVIEESGVYLTFNPNEMAKAVNNNPAPIQGMNIDRKIVFVHLPNPEGSDQVLNFAEKLKNALMNAVSGGIQVKVDMTGQRKNEITISTITYCFPLRTLEVLPFLKERYDYLVSNPNEARQNKIVLHTEGTGEQFPCLFVENEKSPSEVRKIYIPYLMIASAMGVIRYADKEDGSGTSAFGTVEQDALGFEVLTPLADQFIDIPYTEKFTEAFGEELREKVEVALKTDYFHVDKRKGLLTAVQTLIQKTILPECGGNKGSQQFKEYYEAALQALGIINKR